MHHLKVVIEEKIVYKTWAVLVLLVEDIWSDGFDGCEWPMPQRMRGSEIFIFCQRKYSRVINICGSLNS